MSAAKHTLGPWRAIPGGCVVAGEGGAAVLITSVPRGKGAGATERRDADARLIAAAPALADALEGLRKRYPGDEPPRFCDHAADPCPFCDAARAALHDAGRLF